MILELVVRNLGVIEEIAVVFGPGMTALTGETGAGKTLVVGALDLLLGGRADTSIVRAGTSEATVEGRFLLTVDGEEREVVLRRVVPADGRSRAYVDGNLATVAALVACGRDLVDLHGQHDHQSLLGVPAQRRALDVFGGIDLGPLDQARARVREVQERLDALGGDERARAREIDLLRFQVEELDAAALDDDDEDGALDREERLLADAVAHREAAAVAVAHLRDEDGAIELVGRALAAVSGRDVFSASADRLHQVVAELEDVGRDLREAAEGIDDDPARLAAVRTRRQLLRELRRKYGDTLADVRRYREEARARLGELEAHDRIAAALDAEREELRAEVRRREAEVGAARAAAAPPLAAAVEANLASLAMERSRLAISVGPPPGDDVTFRLAANPGSEPLPLAKVASGGELARTMLALRLVLSEAPPTLVFDEVDAGVGGRAALAVGSSLAQLGRQHQVLVVTHLPQVAAHADHHLVVEKVVRAGTTSTTLRAVDGDDRAAELARMLTGDATSDASIENARDLLARTAETRSSARMPRPSRRPRRADR